MGACCCLKPKNGCLLVGLFNILVGLATIGGVGYLLYEIFSADSDRIFVHSTPNFNSFEEFFRWFHSEIQTWPMAICYLAPGLTTFILGLFILIAVCKTDSIMGTLAFVLNIVLILGCFADILCMYFLVMPHVITLAPILIWGLIQMYLIWALHDFRSTDLKTEVDV